ncbi:ABC transporter ATP-binding protein [Magnetococcales bacterium HHB-1]
MPPSAKKLLQVEKASISVADKRIIKDLSLDLKAGSCVAVLGRNGVGKTTLLKTLAGLLPLQKGSIDLDGEKLHNLSRRKIAKKLGILFQQSVENFPTTVLESVLSGRFPHLEPWQLESDEDFKKARQALKDVNLAHFESRFLDTLSGGERRRLDFAVLLCQEPQILLLDEPVNHLDLRFAIHLLDHMQKLARKEHRAVLMVLHDMNLAARFCEQMLFLYGEGDWEIGTRSTMMTPERLSRLYDYPISKKTFENLTLWYPL